jgi:hypothetical protein
MLLRNPFPVIAVAVALLALWAWLFLTGTILILDRSGAVARVEAVTWWGPRPLLRLPAGLWVGLPAGDGTVRLVCRDGSAQEHGYFSSATHLRLRVAKDGSCLRVERL